MKKRSPTNTSFSNGHIPGNAVLTPQNALDIRREHAKGETKRSLSMRYGVSFSHVSDIVNHKRWKNAALQARNNDYSL